MNEAAMWSLIHAERARLAQTLSTLTPEQWAHSTLCAGWNVQHTAAHVVAGAEQTPAHFLTRLAASLFRFDVMTDVDARRIGALSPPVIVQRLRATTTTTNHPPAPIVAMLGEVVAHAEDICQPLGISSGVAHEALVESLTMFVDAGFPIGSKKRAVGLTLRATDLDWTHGSGPSVEGPATWLMLALLGRATSASHLTGDGLGELTRRLP
jgi:uncharacterized protein (TIGR03083 family)